MIKMVLDTQKGRVLVLGLSRKNMNLLQLGQPIDIDTLQELHTREFAHVLLYGGETEKDMMADLIRAGLIPNDEGQLAD